MNHAELSRQLAIAIGYAPECVYINKQPPYEWVQVYGAGTGAPGIEVRRWSLFDYRNPTIALPVLEWLMRGNGAILSLLEAGFWISLRTKGINAHASTLEEAIARAAVAVGGKGE